MANSTNQTILKDIFRRAENIEISKYGAVTNKGFCDIESTDGNTRFKLGLIDFLTLYSSKKFIENQVKAKYSGVSSYAISAIDQDRY